LRGKKSFCNIWPSFDSQLKEVMSKIFQMGAWVVMSLVFAQAGAQEAPIRADQVVNAMETQSGVTPGQRRNHINGVCFIGHFVGDPAVSAFSRSSVFSGQKLPVVGRFSLAGGSLKTPDTARSPRGMALELHLPRHQIQHFTLLNVPVFGAATPEAFHEALLANTPEKLAAYRASHPEAKALQEYLAIHNPIVSYTGSDFYGIHAFKMSTAKGQTTLVKWRFVPREGVERLSDEALKTAPPRFLNEALFKRVSAGPVQWDMILVIGQPGDEQTNPTLSWPPDRPQVHAGVLTLTQASPESGAECEKINFDPLVMAPGIAPTQDPILLFRSSAYAVSYGRRLVGQ
jgi:catalase